MTKTVKRRALVLRAFDDAGTGKSYKAGATVTIKAGIFVNYEAAGLVCAAEPAPRRRAPRA